MAVTAVAACLAACGSQTSQGGVRGRSDRPPEGPRLGAFAGYNERLPSVTMIAASWRVPRIPLTSSHGFGSTWLGIQQPCGGNCPFIQVGTNYWRDTQDYDHYDAFWSDTTKRFRPVLIFRVDPGDRITATLVRELKVWGIYIDDHTLHTHRTIKTTEETQDGALRQAEWLQEDPSTKPGLHVTTHLPYARTNTVRFSHLTADWEPAAADRLFPAAMKLPGAALVPTPVAHDSFSLRSQPR
jgi:hypothetical protein